MPPTARKASERKTLPDRSEDFQRFLALGGRVLGAWSADKTVGMMLMTNLSIEAVEVWVYPDERDVAYLARYTRKGRGSTVAHAEIIGQHYYGVIGATATYPPEDDAS